ncbi:hypothetical protein GGR52DRAFT_561811 [Hypoxylon sp. FL1284]|nr:hypothetical protein GGR52DRAFT_561811 [Hypoxylon sp. FL1284]
MAVRERWLDPAGPAEYNEEQLNEMIRWKNLNSFIARLSSNGFVPGMSFPIWQLREALEDPATGVSKVVMECRIWVACEWIINCANIIFEDMNSKIELDEGSARALRGGPLYDGKPLSLDRWSFWKRRLSQLSSDMAGSDITARIANALDCMDSMGG